MTTLAVDPYGLDDGSDSLLAVLEPTLVARGQHRTDTSPITQVGSSAWRVPGDPKMGDARPWYTVTHDDYWRCYCAKGNGHNICSHITAVISWRQSNPDVQIHKLDDISQSVDVPEVSASRQGHVPPLACPLPTDPIFGAPRLPARFKKIHPHQWDAVESVVEQFRTNDLVFLDAPVGSGKTLVAELARRLLPVKSTAYICSSIQLQQQMLDSFPYAREIKGRSNYPTTHGPDNVTCADCTSAPPADPSCYWCAETRVCPYRLAKSHAADAPLAVLNTSYFLHAANYANEFSGRDLVIVDEADTVEKNLMGFVEVSIGDRHIKELDCGLPKFVTKPESWQEWINGKVLPGVSNLLADIPSDTDDVQQIRRRQTLQQLGPKLDVVAAGLLDGNWVFDDYQSGRATFRPIKVNGYGPASLWQHGRKSLFMSATIISPDVMAESLGWERDFGVVTVPHTFPVENRKIQVVPVAPMTRSAGEPSKAKMAEALGVLADRHADQRMLVHTVSYDLTNYLAEYLSSRVHASRIFRYSKAADRERVLAKFRKTKGGILLAPSMSRGVDLPGEDCDVVVVCKVPWASLGDKQVQARIHSPGGQTWFVVEAIRELVQMTGRHIRSAEDVGITYILDEQFVQNLWKKSRHLLPGWFREALVWTTPRSSLLGVAQ